MVQSEIITTTFRATQNCFFFLQHIQLEFLIIKRNICLWTFYRNTQNSMRNSVNPEIYEQRVTFTTHFFLLLTVHEFQLFSHQHFDYPRARNVFGKRFKRFVGVYFWWKLPIQSLKMKRNTHAKKKSTPYWNCVWYRCCQPNIALKKTTGMYTDAYQMFFYSCVEAKVIEIDFKIVEIKIGEGIV